ncbi:MAG: protein kinase [Labilithrix sp.]|nr:protein kinase [Labilithrix sp.]MCW5811337.1 protein kinase [Labilithrix sp.]
MGVVFVALDPALERKVALKLVRPDEGDSTASLRMSREARAMAKLTHPNVVTVHDVGELPDGQLFLAMELVEGGTLRASARPGDLAQTIDLFLQAARGLAAAHEAGLIHRDFKPDNVLVGRDRRVRVGDFGLVRAADDAPFAAGALTKSGAVLGTPAYMAPEQHLGLPASAKADQYAFAVALHEAIAGERPFTGEYEEIREAKLHRRPPPLPTHAHAPAAIALLLDRALDRDPDRRHPSMKEVIALLETAATDLARTPAPPIAATPPNLARTPALPIAAATAWRERPATSKVGVGTVVGLAFAAVFTVFAFFMIFVVKWTSAGKVHESSLPSPRGSGDVTPPLVPAFVPVVASPSMKAELPCPAGTTIFRDELVLACRRPDRKFHGPFLRFHTNGKLQQQGTYVDDKMNGRFFRFDAEGNPWSIENRVDDRREGVQLMLHANRKVWREEPYAGGVLHGVVREWSSDGTFRKRTRFEHGNVVERE